MMVRSLDRKVVATTDVETKGLYSWCLREIKNETQVGRDYIPWGWSLDFDITDLVYLVKIGDDIRGDNLDESERRAVLTEVIGGNLKSLPKCGSTQYSFFGTGRIVTDISIRIIPDEREGRVLWGSPEYEEEIDFLNKTVPDQLQLTYGMKQEWFDRVAHLVTSGEINAGSLRIGLVEGFYAEWSPGVSTPLVKILPTEPDVPVVDETAGKFNPRRLGKLGDAALTFYGPKKSPPSNNNDDQADGFDEWESPEPDLPIDSALAAQEAVSESVVTIVRRLSIPLWLCALVLIGILFRL